MKISRAELAWSTERCHTLWRHGQAFTRPPVTQMSWVQNWSRNWLAWVSFVTFLSPSTQMSWYQFPVQVWGQHLELGHDRFFHTASTYLDMESFDAIIRCTYTILNINITIFITYLFIAILQSTQDIKWVRVYIWSRYDPRWYSGAYLMRSSGHILLSLLPISGWFNRSLISYT
jgi:hypothetical protein